MPDLSSCWCGCSVWGSTPRERLTWFYLGQRYVVGRVNISDCVDGRIGDSGVNFIVDSIGSGVGLKRWRFGALTAAIVAHGDAYYTLLVGSYECRVP